jgi:hypothetical protein
MEASTSNIQKLNTQIEKRWSDSSSDGSNTPTN